MNEHITKWLNAYYDGELSGRRLEQVEEHLAWCEECQAELDALTDLSDLLLSEAGPENLTPAERFVTQVELMLPREQESPRWTTRMTRAGWLIFPIVLVGIGILFEAVMVVNLILTSLGLVQLPVIGLSGNCLNPMLAQQSSIQIVRCSAGLITRQIWIWAVGLLYISWLAIWWVNRTRQQNEAY